LFCQSHHTNDPDFSLADIYKVIDEYQQTISFRHFLVGGASGSRVDEPERIKKIISYIRKTSDKPIYLMSQPPEKLSDIKDYHDCGLSEIAFNIEIYNREIAKKLMPGKGFIPIEQYFDALEKATECFGRTGNVRSMLIVGLESEASLLDCVFKLCSTGVAPMLSAFRPMPKTILKHIIPPEVPFLKDIYFKAEKICNDFELQLGPLCPECQGNTISMPVLGIT